MPRRYARQLLQNIFCVANKEDKINFDLIYS
jgi:hypothetical protein